MRSLKTGLTILGMMCILSGGASSALGGEFHAESAHVVLQGSKIGTGSDFVFHAGSVACKEAKYAGLKSLTTEWGLSLTPTYNECTAFGFVNATVSSSKCRYEISASWNVGQFTLSCSSPMTITAYNCEVTVSSQTATTTVWLTNEGSGSSRDIRLGGPFLGIKYTQHSKSFPGCSSGTFTNGELKIYATLQAYTTSGERIGLWYE